MELDAVGSGIELRVSDTGQGISAEFLPRVFDRFTRADDAVTQRRVGLGLGLAIVRALVERHGGTVQADSGGRGRGATFTVRFPARACPAAARGLRSNGLARGPASTVH